MGIKIYFSTCSLCQHQIVLVLKHNKEEEKNKYHSKCLYDISSRLVDPIASQLLKIKLIFKTICLL